MTARVSKITKAAPAAKKLTTAKKPTTAKSLTVAKDSTTDIHSTAAWARSQKKNALQLVESLEDRGLLEQDEIGRLKTQAEELGQEASSTDALTRVGNFQKKLANCLSPEGDAAVVSRAKGMETLFEINRQISRIIDPTECCERLLALLNQAIPHEGATLYLVDSATGQLQVAATIGHETDLIDRIQFDGGTGFSGWVARTQKPILFGSLKRSQPTHEGVIKSFMAAPLVVAGKTLGVLTLGHSRENSFNRDDLRLLVMVGTQAAALVQKVVLERRIREVSITDDLTGLYTTGHLISRIHDESVRAGRFLQEFSLVRVSINEFSDFREAVGPESADRSVVEIASILKDLARGTDLVARTGPAEFALLLPVTNRDEAEAAARRLAAGIESHSFPRRKRLSASTAAVTFPEDAAEPQELLRAADNVLERARRRNRDEYTNLPAASAS
ncbi:MAG: sensor domain-containing diguanylate cyclase [Candidatus Eisenbacteria bacterium]|nr:sensor domain-containing diguanylate cyclase [Candidatus Eisenbacteria bacterium]